jgi:acetyl coenzyme A synthetase (ADP forming)-like protein
MSNDPSHEYGRGLGHLLAPGAIAVIGASTRAETLGGKVLQNLLAGGFHGPVYPVNPRATSVQSVRAYRTISDVPEPVDLAIVVVPGEIVQSVVEDCGQAGVKAVIVISAGFAETGGEGVERERVLAETASSFGMRLLGPNCMGAINTDPAVGMDATFSPVPAIEGGVGLVSQSGALGVAILNQAADLSLGLSSFLSIGNHADVGVVDALAWWTADERTRVAAMYIESFGEVRGFLEVARRLSRAKPLLAVKAGRSEAGARAATSHTGALATSDLAVEALLQQCGVLRAPTVQDLCHWAAAFQKCPLPGGRGVAIVTNAGGPGIMAADAISSYGLDLPELAPETRKALGEFLPPEAALRNPVDMISSATADDYCRAVEQVLGDPAVDMVLVLNVTPILYKPLEIVEGLAGVPGSSQKPCLSVFMAEDAFYPEAARVPGAPPIYRFPETAVRALRALCDYAEWRSRPVDAYPEFDVDRERAVTVLAEAGERPGAGGDTGQLSLLSYAKTIELLEAYGIILPQQTAVSSPAEAAEAAARIGGKVALKATGGNLLHKTDVGGVALHLQGAAEVLARARQMEQKISESGQALEGFVVQSMAESGVELIVGARREPVYGSMLMVGLGGLFAEALKDVQVRLLPVTPTEAQEMLESLKGYPLLAGEVRGPGVHVPTVVDLLGRIALLMEDLPDVVEIELNPVICTDAPGAYWAVDAVVRCGQFG